MFWVCAVVYFPFMAVQLVVGWELDWEVEVALEVALFVELQVALGGWGWGASA